MGQIDTRSAADFYLRGAQLGTNQAFGQQDQALQMLNYQMREREFGQRERHSGLDEAYRQEQLGLQERIFAHQQEQQALALQQRKAKADSLYTLGRSILDAQKGQKRMAAGAAAGPGGKDAIEGLNGFGGQPIGVYQDPGAPADDWYERALEGAHLQGDPEVLEFLITEGQELPSRMALMTDSESVYDEFDTADHLLAEDPVGQALLRIARNKRDPKLGIGILQNLHEKRLKDQSAQSERATLSAAYTILNDPKATPEQRAQAMATVASLNAPLGGGAKKEDQPLTPEEVEAAVDRQMALHPGLNRERAKAWVLEREAGRVTAEDGNIGGQTRNRAEEQARRDQIEAAKLDVNDAEDDVREIDRALNSMEAGERVMFPDKVKELEEARKEAKQRVRDARSGLKAMYKQSGTGSGGDALDAFIDSILNEAKSPQTPGAQPPQPR